MAVTTTSRFGIYRWSSGADAFTRVHMDTSHQQIEAKGAIYAQGLFSARPSAGVQGRFFFATDTSAMYYDTGSAWADVQTTASIASSLIDAKGDLIVGASDNTPAKLSVGTEGYVLTAKASATNGIAWEALPAATITESSTSTFTNKTISADNNTISGIAASSFVLSNASGNLDGSASQKVIPTGTVVGTSDTQTLTNKTLTNVIYTQEILTPTFTTNVYTLVLTDQGDILLASNAATAGTINIPTNASVAFPTGTQITVIQTGSGQLTIQATTPGTTTIASTGATATAPKLRAIHASATLIKTGTDSWYVVGDIS